VLERANDSTWTMDKGRAKEDMCSEEEKFESVELDEDVREKGCFAGEITLRVNRARRTTKRRTIARDDSE
jgi:hypothetical protein